MSEDFGRNCEFNKNHDNNIKSLCQNELQKTLFKVKQNTHILLSKLMNQSYTSS